MPGFNTGSDPKRFEPDLSIVDEYVGSLISLVGSVSNFAQRQLPRCLTNFAGVVSSSDGNGGLLIQLFDDTSKPVFVNDVEYPVDPNNPPSFHYRALGRLDSEVFRKAPKSGEPVICIEAHHIGFRRIQLSSKAYADRYWKDSKALTFALDAPEVIPVRVEPTGSVLGIEMLWGAEEGGIRIEEPRQYFKLFGGPTVKPVSQSAVRDEAFIDFVSIVKMAAGREATAPCSFTEVLSSLSDSLLENVLILGAYREEAKYDELKAALESHGYRGFLLREFPDVTEQSNVEKMVLATMASVFVVVLDDYPSGHIAELQSLLSLRFRPVIVVRTGENPSTAFLEDSIRLDENIRVHASVGISPKDMTYSIKWARNRLKSRAAKLDEVNAKWRKKK
jgi:hypothetical protein